jgi:hypothetical protein
MVVDPADRLACGEMARLGIGGYFVPRLGIKRTEQLASFQQLSTAIGHWNVCHGTYSVGTNLAAERPEVVIPAAPG